MKKVLFAIFLLGSMVVSKAQNREKSSEINNFMSTIYKQGQFSGAVLVAERGKVIYKNGFGFAERKTQEPFTTSTPCYIGSLSKQFTAMGIMMLKERKMLDYNDPIRKYFPQLPAFMQSVTIRSLLTHSSGLAIFDDFPGMAEKDVFNIILRQNSLRMNPGEKFEYCNANYTLLGMVIEKISHSSLNEFLTDNIFKPVGMKGTYVDEPSLKNKKRAVGYYLFGEPYNYSTYIGGAASVVSSVEDLYKWDQYLYNPKIVTKKSLEEAFEIQSKIGKDEIYEEKGYGFGWFVNCKGGEKIIQHDGGFAGFRAYIERQIDRDNTIILISNVRHSLTGQMRTAINNILENKSAEIPKRSYANWIIAEATKENMDKAIEKYKVVANGDDSSRYYFSENEFNSLGYYLIRSGRIDDAVKFFALNAEKNPNSANAFDSLGEAYMKAGDKQSAINSYRKSIRLNPDNFNAANMLRKLQE